MSLQTLESPFRFIGQGIVNHKLFVFFHDPDRKEYVVKDDQRATLFTLPCESFDSKQLIIFARIFMAGAEYVQTRINRAVQESLQ